MQDVYSRYPPEPSLASTADTESTITGRETDIAFHLPNHRQYTLDDELDLNFAHHQIHPQLRDPPPEHTRLHRCLLPNCGWAGEEFRPDSWVEHVLGHFSDLPRRPKDDQSWRYEIACGRCGFDFVNRSWNTIVRHIYDKHIQNQGDLRTVRCISTSLTRYLEHVRILPTGTGSHSTEMADNPARWGQYSDHTPTHQPQRPWQGYSNSPPDREYSLSHAGGFDAGYQPSPRGELDYDGYPPEDYPQVWPPFRYARFRF